MKNYIKSPDFNQVSKQCLWHMHLQHVHNLKSLSKASNKKNTPAVHYYGLKLVLHYNIITALKKDLMTIVFHFNMLTGIQFGLTDHSR